MAPFKLRDKIIPGSS